MEHNDATTKLGKTLLEIDFNLTPEITTTPRRTVRQQQGWPNREKTAEQSNKESASLSLHSQPTGGRATIPDGSAAVNTTAPVLQSHRTILARPPDGRHSSATAKTAIHNDETVCTTARKRNEPLTAFELPRLIRPQPLRCRGSKRRTAIKPFYLQLVAFIFSSRYATASQLLRRFPELLSTERTTQRHLQNMANHGLISIASTRGTSPNFPFAYFATGKGIGYLKQNLANGDRVQIPVTEERRSRGQALHSLIHELCVTEVAVLLDKTVRDRGDIDIVMQERRYFRSERRLSYRDNGMSKRIEPDFGFLPAITDPTGVRRLLPMFFVEVELGTHRVAAINAKLAAYDKWAVAEGDEYLNTTFERLNEQKTNPNFRLLLVACDAYGGVGDDRKLLDLLMEAIQLPSKMRDRIWLCKATDLNTHARAHAPLNAPIWLRAKDAKYWLPEFRSTMADRQEGRGAYVPLREFIRNRIGAMPFHSLFPH